MTLQGQDNPGTHPEQAPSAQSRSTSAFFNGID
jgi:hypothetical protein